MLDSATEGKGLEEVIASKVSDNVILNIVNMVNYGQVNLDMTLFCKGTVIAGDVISGKEYFTTMAESLSERSSQVSQFYTGVCNEFYEAKASDYDPIPLNYIHLKNVSVKGGNTSFAPFEGGLLRMRIDEIDGHMIGRAS